MIENNTSTPPISLRHLAAIESYLAATRRASRCMPRRVNYFLPKGDWSTEYNGRQFLSAFALDKAETKRARRATRDEVNRRRQWFGQQIALAEIDSQDRKRQARELRAELGR